MITATSRPYVRSCGTFAVASVTAPICTATYMLWLVSEIKVSFSGIIETSGRATAVWAGTQRILSVRASACAWSKAENSVGDVRLDTGGSGKAERAVSRSVSILVLVSTVEMLGLPVEVSAAFDVENTSAECRLLPPSSAVTLPPGLLIRLFITLERKRCLKEGSRRTLRST